VSELFSNLIDVTSTRSRLLWYWSIFLTIIIAAASRAFKC